jgi:hypothetical protein
MTGQRGLATGLVAASLLLLSGLLAAAAIALVLQLTAHRVQGAADLVAVTAAQAENLGTSEACAAAARAAAADDVRLVGCRVVRKEPSFAVSVTVVADTGRVLAGIPLESRATSHAGVIG